MAGLVAIVVVLILCVSVLFGLYMCICSDNEVRMFANPRYEERIEALEKEVKQLKEGK